jgi:hypothetical protein
VHNGEAGGARARYGRGIRRNARNPPEPRKLTIGPCATPQNRWTKPDNQPFRLRLVPVAGKSRDKSAHRQGGWTQPLSRC